MKKFLYRAAVLICLVVILISAYQLYSIFSEYAKGKALYEDTAQRYIVKQPDQDAPERDDNSRAGAEAGEETLPPVSVDFEGLLQENPDVVGWLYCEDTPINYPVLRGADNDEYLHHMVDGTYNSSGSIFMDYRCSADFSSLNTIIYGHNMKNDTMFGTLHDYSEQSYYDSHPFLWLLTPETNYRIDLIAGYISPADGEIYDTISDEGQLQSCVSQAMTRSTFLSTAEYSEISSIITLSTCSYEYDEARYILLGIPVPVS